MSKPYNSDGFTLIEVAIVLAVIGLLLAGGVNLLSGSADTAKYKHTQYDIQEIKESLITYYTQLKRLPCPDVDGDGIENPPIPTGTCTNVRGFLPHVTLGIGGSGDAWGERIKYIVSPVFVTEATTTFCGSYARVVANQIIVQDLQATPATLGEWGAFALLSTGKNGRQTNFGMTGAFTNDGGCAGLSVREQENCDTDSTLRFGNPMTDGMTVVFDDMVIWVGDMQLISQLRRAGACDSSASSSSSTPAVCSTPGNSAAKCNAGCPGYEPGSANCN